MRFHSVEGGVLKVPWYWHLCVKEYEIALEVAALLATDNLIPNYFVPEHGVTQDPVHSLLVLVYKHHCKDVVVALFVSNFEGRGSFLFIKLLLFK